VACYRRQGRQARMPVLLELKLEGELDGAGAADLVEGVEAAIGAAGAQAAGQRLRRVAKQGTG